MNLSKHIKAHLCFFPCVYSFTYPLEGNKTHNTCPQCITILGLLNFIKAFYSNIILVTVLPSESEQSQEIIVLQLHGFQYADNLSAQLDCWELKKKNKKKSRTQIQFTDVPFGKLEINLIYFALLTMLKPLTLYITINYGKFWKRWKYQTTWPASWETCMQVRKQQLELDMEQHTGSK